MKQQAPFSDDQQEALREWQRNGGDPYRCPYRVQRSHRGEGILAVTGDGLACDCGFLQNWAFHHDTLPIPF